MVLGMGGGFEGVLSSSVSTSNSCSKTPSYMPVHKSWIVKKQQSVLWMQL